MPSLHPYSYSPPRYALLFATCSSLSSTNFYTPFTSLWPPPLFPSPSISLPLPSSPSPPLPSHSDPCYSKHRAEFPGTLASRVIVELLIRWRGARRGGLTTRSPGDKGQPSLQKQQSIKEGSSVSVCQFVCIH